MKRTCISFVPSSTPLVSYKLYLEPVPKEVDYNSEAFLLGGATFVDLSLLPGMEGRDGVFNIGVTAVGGNGNESDMVYLSGIPVEVCCSRCPRRYSDYPILAGLLCELKQIGGSCGRETDEYPKRCG